MINNKREGRCAICGMYKDLSFEHFPPKNAKNSDRLKVFTMEEFFKSSCAPWETDNLKYISFQKGLGANVLCKECNNSLGSWYSKEYISFSNSIAIILNEDKYENQGFLQFSINDLKPLNLIKQIIAIFCCINPSCRARNNLKEFLLNRENKTFKKNKYRISIYITKNGIKTIPMSIKGDLYKDKFCMISEFVYAPLGFVLEVDYEGESIYGTDITSFVDYDYNAQHKVDMSIPIKENNSYIPCDFRTKEELIKCKKDNMKRE